MTRVFISYSTADSKIAGRIYYDLQRSGLKVYLYEREGEYGVDFREEIYQQLNEVDYFCLIDSPNARRSEWVKKECMYARSRQNIRKIQPCFVLELDKWQNENELFDTHVGLRGINFSGLNRLDYREIYRSRMNELCEVFEATYKPWSDIPGNRDFEKELALLELQDAEKNFLRNDYSNFVYCADRSGRTALSRINNLIDACNELNVSIGIVYLAKGKILADLNDDLAALQIFQHMSSRFPDDPRSWAALSGAQYYTTQFNESLRSLEKAIEIINANPLNQYQQEHLPELILKKARLLIEMGSHEKARYLLDSVSENIKEQPEFLIAQIRLELLSNKNLLVDKYKALRKIYDFSLNPDDLNRLVGDLEFTIGRFYHADIEIAAQHYYLAYSASPRNISYTGQLALIYTAIAHPYTHTIIKKGLLLSCKSNEDKYYYGLLKFLNHEPLEALKMYKESKKNDWPEYTTLLT